jgi:hypothetical protein
VPNVVGRTPDDACLILLGANLSCQKNPRSVFGSPAQQILGQNPAAGADVAPGSAVALDYYNSAGVAVPAVQGLTVDDACTRIQSAGLVCNRSGQPNPGGDAVAPQTVWAPPTPAEGTVVGSGATVTVVFEDTPTVVLWQLHQNGAYGNDFFLGDAAPSRPGWTAMRLGTIYTAQTGGTRAWYHHRPAVPGQNVAESLDTNPNAFTYWGVGELLGFFANDYTQTGHYLCGYTKNSDSYYSTQCPDPVGERDYPNPTPPGETRGASHYLWP